MKHLIGFILIGIGFIISFSGLSSCLEGDIGMGILMGFTGNVISFLGVKILE